MDIWAAGAETLAAAFLAQKGQREIPVTDLGGGCFFTLRERLLAVLQHSAGGTSSERRADPAGRTAGGEDARCAGGTTRLLAVADAKQQHARGRHKKRTSGGDAGDEPQHVENQVESRLASEIRRMVRE